MGTSVFRKRLRELHRPERMLALSDGVIAVAITLLVLDLKVPDSAKGGDDATLRRDLLAMLPTLYMYAMSFLVVGLAWLGHHSKFAHIHKVDSRLLWLNMLFLMTVGLVPFVTAVQSQSRAPTAVVLYSGTIGLVMALSAVMSAYALSRPELSDAATPAAVRRRLLLSPTLAAAICAASAAAALVDVGWSRYVMLLLIPAAIYSGAREQAPSAT